MHALLHPRLAGCRRIFLRNCALSAHIGAYDHEKQAAQRLLVNADVYVPLSASTPSHDRLDEVVDYNFILHAINNLLAQGHINLQETFCDALAARLLAHPAVKAVRVSTEKPDAYDHAESMGVEVFHIKPDATHPERT